MTTFQNAGSRLFAAAFALAFSAIAFATAIAPANQGMLLPGVIA